MRTRLAFMIGVAALSLGACATADGAYGSGGYAYGYDSPYGFNCYGNGLYGYGGYGGYGVDNCGWYNGLFYPGFGNFVFDRHHHRHQMTMGQHNYFTRQARGPDGQRRVGLGSSGGVIPPPASQPQMRPGNGTRPSSVGTRNPGSGFGGGGRSHGSGRHG